jgi:hypothetical protein
MSDHEEKMGIQHTTLKKGKRYGVDWNLSIEVAVVVGIDIFFNINTCLYQQVEQAKMESVLFGSRYYPIKEYEDYGLSPDAGDLYKILEDTFSQIGPLLANYFLNLVKINILEIVGVTEILVDSITDNPVGKLLVSAGNAGYEFVIFVFDSKIRIDSVEGSDGAASGVLKKRCSIYKTPYLKSNVELIAVGDQTEFFRKTGIITNKKKIARIKSNVKTYLYVVGHHVKVGVKDEAGNLQNTFPSDVQVILNVTDEDLSLSGFSESDIKNMGIYYYDEDTNVWEKVAGSHINGREITVDAEKTGF